MKKILSSMIVLTLILSVLCSGALGEAIDVTGEWYANFYGISMTMTLNDSGSYTMQMDMEGEEPSDGTWEFDGTALVMDMDSDTEMTLSYDSEAISFYAEQDGMEFVFTREMPQTFEAAPVRTDTTIEEFTGAWTCTLIDAMGMQAPPEMMGINVGVKIEGGLVTFAIPELLGSEEVTIEGAFADGTLSVTVPAESEYGEDTVFTLQLLEDGTMSVATSFMDETMTFYMSSAEVQE